MIHLRPYQLQGSENARRGLRSKKRVIICAPCGAGKTIIAIDLILRALKKGLRVCFLCDRDELLTQLLKDLLPYGLSIELITADRKVIYPSQLYIGMVETFHRRASQKRIPTDVDLFILDEAHIGNYNKILDMFSEPMFLGLTATPVGSSKNEPLIKRWKDIVIVENTENLIKEGYLVKAIEFGHHRLLSLRQERGDFSVQSQLAAFTQEGLDDLFLKSWKERAEDRQTIVYCIDVNHSIEINNKFLDLGIHSEHVDGSTPNADRIQILGRYKAGFTQVLCNVGITTKGFDSPPTSCIGALFATMSLSKWFQAVGRGGRSYRDEHTIKEDFILFDMGNNILRHGSYNENVDWESIFRNEERDKNFSIKKNFLYCSVCSTIIYNRFILNCEVCGSDLKKHKPLTPEDSMPENLRNKPLDSMTLSELQQYGKIRGYRHNWAFMYKFSKFKRK